MFISSLNRKIGKKKKILSTNVLLPTEGMNSVATGQLPNSIKKPEKSIWP